MCIGLHMICLCTYLKVFSIKFVKKCLMEDKDLPSPGYRFKNLNLINLHKMSEGMDVGRESYNTSNKRESKQNMQVIQKWIV